MLVPHADRLHHFVLRAARLVSDVLASLGAFWARFKAAQPLVPSTAPVSAAGIAPTFRRLEAEFDALLVLAARWITQGSCIDLANICIGESYSVCVLAAPDPAAWQFLSALPLDACSIPAAWRL